MGNEPFINSLHFGVKDQLASPDLFEEPPFNLHPRLV